MESQARRDGVGCPPDVIRVVTLPTNATASIHPLCASAHQFIANRDVDQRV